MKKNIYRYVSKLVHNQNKANIIDNNQSILYLLAWMNVLKFDSTFLLFATHP